MNFRAAARGFKEAASQRLQRLGVEEKVQKPDVGDSTVVVGLRLKRIVRDDDLLERVADLPKGKRFLFALLGSRHGIRGLDVDLPWPAVHDEVNFVLSKFATVRIAVPAFHDSNVHGVAAADEFVVDGVLHEMGEFRLPEIDAGVAKSGVRGIVFHGVVEMASPLYVEPFGYVAIEAQMCGTPIITTDRGAFAETVLHGLTGFRCRTQAEFVAAIRKTPHLDRNFIRDYALNHFSIKKIAPKYKAYFDFVWNVHKNGGYYADAAFRDATFL